MAYSFPEYRLGGVFGAKHRISDEKAADLVQRIENDAAEYIAALRSELKEHHGAQLDPEEQSDSMTSKPEGAEGAVINFSSFRFNYSGFRIECRLSVTVCRHWRRSKIWIRLTRLGAVEKGFDLDQEQIEEFLEQAEALSDSLVSVASRRYVANACDLGFDMLPGCLHKIRIRTFNGTSEGCQRLGRQLDQQRPLESLLQEAPKENSAGQEFESFLRIALPESMRREIREPSSVLDIFKDGRADVFLYSYQSTDSLATVVEEDKDLTEICALGFWQGAEAEVWKSGSHLAGVGLARDFGRQF